MPLVPGWGPAAPSTPRLAHSLRVLMRDVESLWPHRARASDGWIGDAAHSSRASDHNPDASGIVHAVDVTAARMRPEALLAAAVLHPSTRYVIYHGLIYSRSNGFLPRLYAGPNPHRDHLHISILRTTKAERSTRRWLPSSL